MPSPVAFALFPALVAFVAARSCGGDVCPDDETSLLMVHPVRPAVATELGVRTDDPDPKDHYYGSSVSIDGNFMAIGQIRTGGGKVHIYKKKKGGWDFVQTLQGEGFEFGRSLSLSGDRLLVGMTAENETQSAIFLYQRSRRRRGSWTLVKDLRVPALPEGKGQSGFGSDVQLAGRWAAVGGGDVMSGNWGVAWAFDLNTGKGQAVTPLPDKDGGVFASAYMRIFGERALVLTGALDGSVANITSLTLDGDSWKVDDTFPQSYYDPFDKNTQPDQSPDFSATFAKDGRPLALVGLNNKTYGEQRGAKAFLFKSGGNDEWGVWYGFPPTPCGNYQRSAISTTSGYMVVITCKAGTTEGWPVWAYRRCRLTGMWVPMTVQNEAGPAPEEYFNGGGVSMSGDDMAIATGHGEVRMYQRSRKAWVYSRNLGMPSGKA